MKQFSKMNKKATDRHPTDTYKKTTGITATSHMNSGNDL